MTQARFVHIVDDVPELSERAEGPHRLRFERDGEAVTIEVRGQDLHRELIAAGKAHVRRQIGPKATEVVADPGAATTVTREVSEERQALPSLSDEEIVRLVEIGRRVETHYAGPQDIEWAIDRQLDELFLLQARPETVWSRKPRAQPVTGGAMALITAAMTGGAVTPKE